LDISSFIEEIHHCFAFRFYFSHIVLSKRNMNSLPLEILVEIFGELNKGELLNAKLVCRAWCYFISVDHLVWRVVCMKRWVGRCNVDFYNGSWKRMLLDDNMKTKAIEWQWNPMRCGVGIHTFHNSRAAVFQAASYPSCQVLCSRPCIGEEKFYIEFEVIHTTSGAINIGISGRNADVEHRCGFDNNGWSFSLFSGTLFHDQAWACQAVSHNKTLIAPNTRIGMGINMKKRNITFFFNGVNQGVAVDCIPDEVYPSVSLGDVGDCVAIIPNPIIPKF